MVLQWAEEDDVDGVLRWSEYDDCTPIRLMLLFILLLLLQMQRGVAVLIQADDKSS